MTKQEIINKGGWKIFSTVRGYIANNEDAFELYLNYNQK
jgi:hypothetical protein